MRNSGPSRSSGPDRGYDPSRSGNPAAAADRGYTPYPASNPDRGYAANPGPAPGPGYDRNPVNEAPRGFVSNAAETKSKMKLMIILLSIVSVLLVASVVTNVILLVKQSSGEGSPLSGGTGSSEEKYNFVNLSATMRTPPDGGLQYILLKSDGTGELGTQKQVYPITWQKAGQDEIYITVNYKGNPNAFKYLKHGRFSGNSLIFTYTGDEEAGVVTYTFTKPS